jgi:hypothetical protein
MKRMTNGRLRQTLLWLIASSVLVATLSTRAAANATIQRGPSTLPLSFTAWREQQVLEAQNQVLRASARLSQTQGKSQSVAKPNQAASWDGSSRLRKGTEEDGPARAERDVRRAQEALSAANLLSFDDYVTVYVSSLTADELRALAESMSKDELLEVVRSLLNRPSISGSNAAASAAKLQESSLKR